MSMLRLLLLLGAGAYLAGSGCVSRVDGPGLPDRRGPVQVEPPARRGGAPARAPRREVAGAPRDAVSPAPTAPAREALRRPVPQSVARTITLGNSVEGRPIVLHEFGRSGPCLFIFGGIHGSEPTSVTVADGVLDLLRAQPGLYRDCRVAVLPRANPDGLERGRRSNANRVDLNRNFPASNWRHRSGHGHRPASEPETRALLAAMERLKPSAVISIHSIQSQPPCNNFDGPGEPLAETLGRYNGYAVRGSIGYPTPGSFGSWCGVDLQIPTVTLELPRRQAGAAAWQKNQDAFAAVLREFAGQARQAK